MLQNNRPKDTPPNLSNTTFVYISTDWDKVKDKNRKKLLGSHRRQVWRYIEEYVDIKKIDVCPGVIYPKAPITPGLKDLIEDYLNDYALQVVWYDDTE